jgi:hypothetical protein
MSACSACWSIQSRCASFACMHAWAHVSELAAASKGKYFCFHN